MNIYFNNKLVIIKDLHFISKNNSSYSGLIDFIIKWNNQQEEFEFKTSGSTGNPKLIQIKRNQIVASVMMTQKALGLLPSDKVLLCLNPQYIATIMMAARCLILDMDMIIVEPSSNPFDILDENTTLDFASFVPFQIEEIINNNQGKKLDGIRNILIGGAPMSSALTKKLQSLNCNLYQSYGMTETVSHIALMNLNNTHSFHVLDGIEIRQDNRSCLAINGAITNNNWLQTNDIIELISPQEFKWIGRADNVINSGGIKIFPEELEAFTKEVLLEKHFSNSFYFYGKKNDLLGEKLCLVFELKAPKTNIIKELENRISNKFSKYHIAREISVKSVFERTDSGKIVRK